MTAVRAQVHGARRAAIAVAAVAAALLTACAGTSAPAARGGAGSSAPAAGGGTGHVSAGPVSVSAGPVAEISQACAHTRGGNAEVETAADTGGHVYSVWIGCGGIGFARSPDGGRTFLPAVRVPGSADIAGTAFSWDPAVTVGPDGTLYVAYMHRAHGFMYPVVDISTDHGARFTKITAVRPPRLGNWGDRDFIAVGRGGTVYLTWDYGPQARLIKPLCSKSGSCAYAAGDVNAVIQKSTDGGRTFGKITPLGPNFPRNGGYSAPLIVRPDGTVDVLYIDHPVSPGSYALHPGHEVFTSSRSGTTWPNHALWPSKGTLSLPAWWINGDIAVDTAGTLYASWDTQGTNADIGWLTSSANGGTTWSRLVRVTPDTDRAPHIMQVAGGARGVACGAWLTDASPRGYALWLRPYSVRSGWLAPALRVSPRYGKASVWPGDTFGMAVLPGHGAVRIAMSWGSAVRSSRTAQIWSRTVTMG
jgi:hypothetical protein